MQGVIRLTESGLYCEAGDFYIDPWRGVDRAVITHAHSDHARYGSKQYLTARRGRGLLQTRLGSEARIDTLNYRESITLGDAKVSLHPAGHVLGSSQVRVEHRGEVWVITGDYKSASDPTCDALEVVRCHTLISECTFGLPIYRWQPAQTIYDEINQWWRSEQQEKRTCVLLAYSLGKAQRILAGLDSSLGPILVHGAISNLLPPYREEGIALPEVHYADVEIAKQSRGRAMVIAPPSVLGTPWLKKFGPISTGLASGWTQIRGARRRQAVDRGFVLSDHADFPGLVETIRATQCQQVWLTHGWTAPMQRYLTEQGLDARSVATRFEGETTSELQSTETENSAENPPSDEPSPSSPEPTA